MVESERSQVEVEKLVKGLEFKQKMCSSETNTSWKHRLVYLLQNMSNNDKGNSESVLKSRK